MVHFSKNLLTALKATVEQPNVIHTTPPLFRIINKSINVGLVWKGQFQYNITYISELGGSDEIVVLVHKLELQYSDKLESSLSSG